MRKENSVEVFSDRTYTFIKIEDNNIRYEHLSTDNLTNIINALKTIRSMGEDSILFACCYKQYEGSYNIEVDAQEQYERIFTYATKHYKTFLKKFDE